MGSKPGRGGGCGGGCGGNKNSSVFAYCPTPFQEIIFFYGTVGSFTLTRRVVKRTNTNSR